MHEAPDQDLLRKLSKADLICLLELAEQSLLAITRADVELLLARLCACLPTEGMVACSFPSISRLSASDCVLIDLGFPAEWRDEYVQNDYFACDPTKSALKSGAPFLNWYDAFASAKDPAETRYIRRHREHQIGDGVTSATREPRAGRWSYFALRGEALTRGGRDRAMLEHITPYLHEAMRRAAGSSAWADRQSGLGELSKRELEVLRWAMSGKTNWEISQILCISERTVKFHMHRLMAKLDASSRAHAVAIATSHGLI